MGNRRRFVALVIVVVAVGIGLSMAWEFVIEDYIAEELFGEPEGSESFWKKWEDVAEGVIFVVLAVIFPLLLLRSIATRQRLVEGLVLKRTAEIRRVNEALVMEITERKRAEEDRHQALIRAEQANQAKSVFLANVSHELRTPLNAIIGFSDIMRQQPPGILDDVKYREYADNIHDSAGHLLNLITDLVDISTIDTGEYRFEKERFQFPQLVAGCFQTLAVLAGDRGVALEADLGGDLPPLQADRGSVRKILLNLLSNAVQFTPEGGAVCVSAAIDEPWFAFIVADTGMGIPAADIPKLTDPFERGRRDPYRSEDGSGIGLAITLSLVKLHGGTLDIASEVGAGTRVTVRLPIETTD